MELIYFGNSILRKKCLPIKKVTEETRLLIAKMIEIVEQSGNGVGLAANQVGVTLRIFIIKPQEVRPDGAVTFGPPKVYINPILSNPSEETETAEEGCLSLPGLHLPIERPYAIEVEATNLEDEVFSEIVQGFNARVIMHESDHLNGRLFIDRLTRKEKMKIKPQLKLIKEKYKNLSY